MDVPRGYRTSSKLKPTSKMLIYPTRSPCTLNTSDLDREAPRQQHIFFAVLSQKAGSDPMNFFNTQPDLNVWVDPEWYIMTNSLTHCLEFSAKTNSYSSEPGRCLSSRCLAARNCFVMATRRTYRLVAVCAAVCDVHSRKSVPQGVQKFGDILEITVHWMDNNLPSQPVRMTIWCFYP